jgi:hypothetical protein
MLYIQSLIFSAEDLGYAVESYDESPAIYFENKGQASLYNIEWKTIMYVNVKSVTNHMNTLEQYFSHINKLCHKMDIKNSAECIHFYDVAKDKLWQVQNTEKLLLDLIECRYVGNRVKRGVFNSVGEVSNILFGTMDDDDAQYYNEQIKRFEQNSGSVTDVLKQQLYVVKSSLGAINDPVSGIVYNEAKMRRGLLQVKD